MILAAAQLMGRLRIVARVTEAIDDTEDELRRKLSLVLSLPDPKQFQLAPDLGRDLGYVVPLMPVRRGIMLDAFDAHTSDGRRMTILPRERGRDLTAAVLETLWESVTSGRAAWWHIYSPSYIDEIHSTLMAHKPGEDIKAAWGRKHAALMRMRVAFPQLSVGEFFRLRHAFYSLTHSYYLWAVLPPGTSPATTVSYSYQERYIARRQRRLDANGIRRLLGLAPYRLHIPLYNVGDPPGYHFQMDAPQGHYAIASGFTMRASGQSTGGAKYEWRNPGFPPLRSLSRDERSQLGEFSDWASAHAMYTGSGLSARSHVHLYLSTKDRLPSPPSAFVMFRERPPGTISAVLWIVGALVLMLGALLLSYQNIVSESQDRLVAAGLLLSVPGLAAAAVGRSIASRELLRAPVLTRAALCVTAVVSLVIVVHLLLLGDRACDSAPAASLFGYDWWLPATIVDVMGDKRVLEVAWIAAAGLWLWLAIRRFFHHVTFVALRDDRRFGLLAAIAAREALLSTSVRLYNLPSRLRTKVCNGEIVLQELGVMRRSEVNITRL